MRSHKALATRLLFILTRCSRLVMSEERAAGRGPGGGGGGGAGAAFMTALPRSKGPGKLRRFSGFPMLRHTSSKEREAPEVPPRAAAAAGSPGLLRSSTAPSRSFKDALQGMHHLRLHEPRPPALSPMPESPSQLRSPGSDASSMSHARAVGLSPLGRSVVTALEAELEQAAAEGGSGVGSRSSPGPGSAADGASPPVSPGKERRSLLTILKRQFRSLAGMPRDEGAASDTDASEMSRDAGSTPDGGSTPRILPARTPAGAAAGQPQQVGL